MSYALPIFLAALMRGMIFFAWPPFSTRYPRTAKVTMWLAILVIVVPALLVVLAFAFEGVFADMLIAVLQWLKLHHL